MGWGINPISDRRRGEQTERERVRREVRRRDRSCRARDLIPAVRCGGPLDVHEIIPRSAWRKGYLVVDNCVLICRAHHQWVDANPDEAHANGLHGYSFERPDVFPTEGDSA